MKFSFEKLLTNKIVALNRIEGLHPQITNRNIANRTYMHTNGSQASTDILEQANYVSQFSGREKYLRLP